MKLFRKKKLRQEHFSGLPKWSRRWMVYRPYISTILLISSLIAAYAPLYFEQQSILKLYEGMEFPSGDPDLYLNFNETEIQNVRFSFPFKVSNDGFYPIRDIVVSAQLSLQYVNKEGKSALTQIFEGESNPGSAPVGEEFTGTVEGIYGGKEFDRNAINEYLENADPDQKTEVILHLDISFYLVGIEKDRIVWNINLSEESPNLDPEARDSGSTEILSAQFTLLNLLVCLSFLFLMVQRAQQLKKSQKSKPRKPMTLQKPKRSIKQLISQNKPLLKRILISTAYLMFFLIWYLVSLSQVSTSHAEQVDTGDYPQRVQFVMTTSIIILLIVSALNFLPSFLPKLLPRYSVKLSIYSLAIKILILVNFGLWILTSQVTYIVDENITLIQDTTPSLFMGMIFLALNASFGIMDITVVKSNSEALRDLKREEIQQSQENRVKKEQRPTVEELNHLIFLAVQNEHNTISQIRKYILELGHPPIARTGESVNQAHLQSLVNELLLIKDPDTQKYSLSPKTVPLNPDLKECPTCGVVSNTKSFVKKYGEIYCPACSSII